MKSLEKFAVYILYQTDEFNLSEIADFFHIEYEEASRYALSDPAQWGQYFDLRELLTLKNLVNQKTTECKILENHYDFAEEVKHLDRIWTKLNTRIESLTDGDIPYADAETRH